MPTATDIQARCSILSPELALPSGSHSTTTRSHGALHVLGTPRPHQSESLHCLSIPLCHSVVPVATIPVASLLCKTFLIVIIIHFHFSDKIHSDINVNQVLQHCWDLSFYTWVDNSGLTKIRQKIVRNYWWWIERGIQSNGTDFICCGGMQEVLCIDGKLTTGSGFFFFC